MNDSTTFGNPFAMGLEVMYAFVCLLQQVLCQYFVKLRSHTQYSITVVQKHKLPVGEFFLQVPLTYVKTNTQNPLYCCGAHEYCSVLPTLANIVQFINFAMIFRTQVKVIKNWTTSQHHLCSSQRVLEHSMNTCRLVSKRLSKSSPFLICSHCQIFSPTQS